MFVPAVLLATRPIGPDETARVRRCIIRTFIRRYVLVSFTCFSSALEVRRPGPGRAVGVRPNFGARLFIARAIYSVVTILVIQFYNSVPYVSSPSGEMRVCELAVKHVRACIYICIYVLCTLPGIRDDVAGEEIITFSIFYGRRRDGIYSFPVFARKYSLPRRSFI